MSNIDDVKDYFKTLQNRICAELETLDGKATFAGTPGTGRAAAAAKAG